MPTLIKIVHGFLLNKNKAEIIQDKLEGNNVKLTSHNCSYCDKQVVGIEDKIIYQNSFENFLEVPKIADDVYLQLCVLAVYFNLKEEDIKTYVFTQGYSD